MTAVNVIVVGGGRMGLPLAAVIADHGACVTVCDVNSAVVDAVNRGESPYEEPHLSEYIARNHAAGRLTASTDTTGAARTAEVAIIIVPAHLTRERDIDYTILRSASAAVGQGLRPGTLVSYETTVAAGGTRSSLIPVLEEKSGLVAGRDFQVSYSPERVKANTVIEKLQETPKVVGGLDTASAERAEAFYGQYLGAPVINVETLEAAEFVKLAGMLYRDVNIALANELAAYSEALGVDFDKVRGAANTDGESLLLTPGIGVGGHCTPVYPYFIIHDGARKGTPQRLAIAARELNDAQPGRSVERLARCLGTLRGKRVHILGLAFRPDVKVDIFGTAYPLRAALEGQGAVISMEDPFYTDEELRQAGFATATAGRDPMDAVILNTAHSAFRTPDFARWRELGVAAVLDGRRCWSRGDAEAAGLRYLGVGQG